MTRGMSIYRLARSVVARTTRAATWLVASTAALMFTQAPTASAAARGGSDTIDDRVSSVRRALARKLENHDIALAPPDETSLSYSEVRVVNGWPNWGNWGNWSNWNNWLNWNNWNNWNNWTKFSNWQDFSNGF